MKKIILFLCLGLAGCATLENAEQKSSQEIMQPAAVDTAEIARTISVFSRAIESDPNYAGAYYNRAKAYFYLKDYEKSWRDVQKAESLGLKFNPEFMEQLEKASEQGY